MDSLNYCRIGSAIGNTPLLKIGNVWAKLESVNPSGSIKDRMADWLIQRAEENGELKKGECIVEATSGNTGIALAMISANKGYRFTAVMPSNMSNERKEMIRAFGAEITEVGAGDFNGACKKRDEIAKETGAYVPNQFCNSENARCHELTTGKEILNQMNGNKISAFVAGTGTGGTLIGVGNALREKFPDVKTIAVEPAESAVMSGGDANEHIIQGIGDGFIPDIVKNGRYDGIEAVKGKDALEKTKALARDYGLFVGISSGANVIAAERIFEKYGGEVVTVLPDSGNRYLSMLK